MVFVFDSAAEKMKLSFIAETNLSASVLMALSTQIITNYHCPKSKHLPTPASLVYNFLGLIFVAH